MISITILNWDEYNPQDFKTRYPHWFRVSKDLLQSKSLFGLDLEERWVWVGLLCLACEEKSKTISGTKAWICHRIGVPQNVFESAIEKLIAGKTIELKKEAPEFTANELPVNSQSSANKCLATEHNSTIQDNTEQDIVPRGEPLVPVGKTAGGLIWDAYESAYRSRYGDIPVRNAKQNGICAQLAKRLAISEAPEVVRFYLKHGNAYYVREGHSLQALLKDCEKLRTEWSTGRVITQGHAKQSDLRQTNVSAVQEYLRRAP